MKKFLATIILLFCSSSIIPADTKKDATIHYTDISHAEQWHEEHPEELPIWLTEEERLHLDEIGKNSRSTLEPPTPVRQPAEFEPMQGVLIRYPLGISTEIVREMAEDITVYCIVSSYYQTTAYNTLNNAGVNMDNVEFLNTSTDTYWIRDYGPWFIFDGNNEAGITDFDYNRPRPEDDAVPLFCSTYFGTHYYFADFVATGGNYMTDGQGIAVSTDLILEENPSLTEAQIDSLVKIYLGIETYHIVPDVNGEYIKHIDCWGKYLSPTQILIREVPTYHSQYDEIEAVVNYFESRQSCFGTNYEVSRVYTPNDQPYTNSLILNNKVFVPIMDNSSYDAQALASYQTALPGYEILGFTGDWYSTDALHCRTMGVTDQEMLYIHHIPINDTIAIAGDITISTSIYAYGGKSLIPDSLLVYWKRSTDIEFDTLALFHNFGNYYSANIPAQPDGTTIEYYIHAADNSGRSENNPYIGAPMAYSFYVENPVSMDEPEHNEITEITNYPNPFHKNTTIAFTLKNKSSSDITIGIYNIRGQLVKTLSRNANNTLITSQWNGTDMKGNNVPAGVYFYRIYVEGKTYTQKMLKIK